MDEMESLATPTAVRESRLTGLHRELGADLVEWLGTVVPGDYGSFPEEVEQLRQACCLTDRSAIDRLEMRGADRERFLSGMVTCDVRELGAEGGVYGFFTSRKGGVLADFALLSFEDRFLLELPPGRGEAIADHLRTYILADRVELAAVEEVVVPLAVAGRQAKRLLRELLGDDFPAAADGRWGHGAATIASVPVTLASRPLLGVDAWTLWVAAEDADTVARALLDAGARPAGMKALDAVRIEAGIPLWGLDYDESYLPQEVGPDEALNFTKGCYLGQEVVARIHYRGGVNRRLVGLEFDGDEPPETGTDLFAEGKPVGKVGSVAISSILEGPIGLAVVHKKAAEPGTRLDVDGDGEAEVAALPFVE